MAITRHDTIRWSIYLVVAAALLILAGGTTWAQTGNSCIDCHESQPQKALRDPAVNMADDIHYTKGFTCESCHGGDPTRGFEEDNASLAHSRAKGFIGAPKPSQIPEMCAKCHSDVELMKRYNPKQRVDQLLEYRSSQHGKLLAQGDERVATCISCHGVHGILAVKDTRSPVFKANIPKTCSECHSNANYMRSYGIPTNQFDLYKASIHGRKLLEEGDLAAPTCSTCHGNHGATPPGLTSISNACGECHANNLDYFNQSPHKEAYADMEIGECETCHGHHDVAKPVDAMLGVGEESVCLDCHDTGDAGYETAARMAARFDTLKQTLARAHELLDRAERGGVDVSLGKFDLHSADDALIKARTTVHYFDGDKFDEVINAGLTGADLVIDQGEAALWDLRLRQIGLAFALPVILWVALALYLRVRRMEREKPFA